MSVSKNLEENLILYDSLDNDEVFPECIMMGVIYPRWESDISTANHFEYCKELNSKVPMEFNRCYDGIGDLLLSTGEDPPLKVYDNLSNDLVQLCRKGLSFPNLFVSLCGPNGEPTTVCGD
ncbi:MAG: hypothetical protein O3A36_04155 [bacterium]|nr:hypothetical protein [bacterium]